MLFASNVGHRAVSHSPTESERTAEYEAELATLGGLLAAEAFKPQGDGSVWPE